MKTTIGIDEAEGTNQYVENMVRRRSPCILSCFTEGAYARASGENYVLQPGDYVDLRPTHFTRDLIRDVRSRCKSLQTKAFFIRFPAPSTHYLIIE